MSDCGSHGGGKYSTILLLLTFTFVWIFNCELIKLGKQAELLSTLLNLGSPFVLRGLSLVRVIHAFRMVDRSSVITIFEI